MTSEGLCTKCSATQYCAEHEPVASAPPPSPDTTHFHSDQCYAVGPGDTEVLICGFGGHAKAEAGPMRDTESPSGVQALASSGPPKLPSPDVGRLIERLNLALAGKVPDVPPPTFSVRPVDDGEHVYEARFCDACNYEQTVSGTQMHGIGCAPLRTARRYDEIVHEAADALTALQAANFREGKSRDEAVIRAEQAEADVVSLRRENNALAYDKTCLQEDIEALRQAQARLVEALMELKGHAEYTLDRSGQRTRPALFVPSVAKRVLEIVAPALASVDPLPVDKET